MAVDAARAVQYVNAGTVEFLVDPAGNFYFFKTGDTDLPTGGCLLRVAGKRAELALRDSEERYRRLVELSPDGIAIHREGRLVFCNPAGARMLGYGVDEVLGKLAIEFVHPSSRHFAADRMKTILVGKAVPFIEEKFVRKDGSPLEVEVGTMPFTFQNAPAIQVIIRDITERKRSEKLQAVLYKIAQTASAVEDVDAFYEQIHGIVVRAQGVVGRLVAS